MRIFSPYNKINRQFISKIFKAKKKKKIKFNISIIPVYKLINLKSNAIRNRSNEDFP